MTIVQQQRQRQHASSLFHTISCYIVMVAVLLCLSSSSLVVVSAVDTDASQSQSSSTSSSSSSSTLRGQQQQQQQQPQQQQQQQQQDNSSTSRNQKTTLKERVRNPFIREDIRGKTFQELGIVISSRKSTITATSVTTLQQATSHSQAQSQSQSHSHSQGRRRTQQKVTLSYFAIYDEFGPFFVSMGDTAGLRGNIYNVQARTEGLTAEFVEGALQGTCSVVATSGKQLCSYEFFLLDLDTGLMATIVATGSVLMELETSNLLIIEATGDDFVEFKGGFVALQYTSIGGQTVMDVDITLDRR